MVKSVRTVLGLTMVLGALAACDDNPMKDDRDVGEYMFTNPSFSTIRAGDSVPITAQVRNQYTAPTGDAVTATPCDSRITALADPTRSEFEAPERFMVQAVSVGTTCLIVSGGGVTDTVGFLVGPGTLTMTDVDTLLSGESAPLSVEFRTLQGGIITELDSTDVRFTSNNSAVVFIDSLNYVMTGRAPGTAVVTATLRSGLGQVITDIDTVVVVAGTFSGTFAPATMTEGTIVTLNAGGIPFDADTRVTFNGVDGLILADRTAAQLNVVVPHVATPTAAVVVSNLGPNQVASTFVAPVNDDAGEPDNFGATSRPAAFGTAQFGVVDGTDADDFFTYEVTGAPRTVTINLSWAGGGDVDVLVFDAAETLINTACATGANPESCTITNLPVGTYYIIVEHWSGDNSQPYRLFVN